MRKNKFLILAAAFALVVSGCANYQNAPRLHPLRAATSSGTATITLGNTKEAGRWAVGQGSGTNTNSTADPAWAKPNPDSGDHTFIDVTDSDDANGQKWTATYSYTGQYSLTRNGGDNPNIQFGKGSYPPTTLSFVSSAFSQTMTLSSFSCKYGGAGASSTISGALYVDDTVIANGDTNTGTGTKTVSYTTGTQIVSAGSVLKVVFDNMQNGVKVYNFSYTLTSAGGGDNSSSNNSQSSDSSQSSSDSSVAPITYAVTYSSNGATSGDVPTDSTAYSSGDSVTVLGKGSLVREVGGVSYNFTGWNTKADGTGTGYVADSQFTITENTTLYAQWSEPSKDSGAVTYQLKNMTNFNNWSNSYGQHSSDFEEDGVGTLNVNLSDAAKPASGQAIDDIPVMKAANSTAVVKLTSDTHYIKAITLHARQWGTKAQGISVCSSTDSGENWGEEITNTTTTFVIRASNLSEGTNAIKFTFSSANQTGLEDLDITYDVLPDKEATSMTISPASLSLFGNEEASFTPTLIGGQGHYEKTISWTSSNTDVIAKPEDSEAGEAVHITPNPVQTQTVVTITGTVVDVDNPASMTIQVTVKVIKTVSVNSVSISGVENNSTLDGSSDSDIALDKTIQLSAGVVYDQGEAYMDGNGNINWATTDADVATVTASGLVTLKGNGDVTITATSAENSNKSNSLTFTVSNLVGSADNPYSVAQARAAITANKGVTGAYATGIISQIIEAQSDIEQGYITYDISTDGLTTSNQLRAYKGKDVDGENFDSLSDLVVGATVVIRGNLKKYSSTYEFDANNELVSYTAPIIKELVSISISGNYQTTFFTDYSFNHNGMVVTATYDDDSTLDVTALATFSDPDFSTPGNKTVTVSYTEDTVTKTATYNITVYENSAVNYGLYNEAIEEGDYIICFDQKAIKNVITSSRADYDEVTPVDNIIMSDDSNIVWHIAPAGDYYTIFNAAKNEFLASTDKKNQAQLIEDGTSDNAKWTISSPSAGVFKFENLARANSSSDPANKWLKNNGTYGFACYASGTGDSLSLYRSTKDEVKKLSTQTTLTYKYEKNGENDYEFSDVAIKFGGFISEDLWNELDTTDHVILGYGVMISTSDLHGAKLDASNADYDMFVNVNTKSHPSAADDSQKEAMGVTGNYYIWNLRCNIADSYYDLDISAVAYIKTKSGYIYLQETSTTVRDLARDYILNRGYLASDYEGSLGNLAGL